MTTIRLHDSLAREKRDFAPIDPRNVRLYVCGPTVYDRAHIGNARPAVVFDVLYRLLRHVHGPNAVTYVRNVTDVEDKILARAAEREIGIDRLTAETLSWYEADMAALGCLPPTHEPRATAHLPGMVALIERLLASGNAYEAEGHVLFHVPSWEGYGRLSGRSTEDMIAGARVEVAPYKRDPMDFVLWKPAAPEEPGWDSPWGRGRPGWHIECSAMSEALLGRDFDIHGGGADLLFPHHENERAQSCCAWPGSGFARYWLHNGMVRVDGRKMSKSLGNFLTMEDLRATAPGEVLRLALLSARYREPLDWSDKLLEDSRKALLRWRAAASGAKPAAQPDPGVVEALADDLNTAAAIARLHELAATGDGAALKRSANLLGLLTKALGGWEAPEARPEAAARIEALLAERAEARKARDFARADAVRDRLAAAGVSVMDKPGAASAWELTPGFDAAKLEEA
jgi:cysteinyl-tRNA synthetase